MINVNNKLYCTTGKLKYGEQLATAFLVDRRTAITALHAVIPSLESNEKIELEFLTIEKKIINVSAEIIDKDDKLDIALLSLVDFSFDNYEFFPLVAAEILEGAGWKTVGCPVILSEDETYHYIKGEVYHINPLEKNSYDMQLTVKDNNSDWTNAYKGYSGSLVLISNAIQGILLTEEYVPNNVPLKAVRIASALEFLKRNRISVIEDPSYNETAVENTRSSIISVVKGVELANNRFTQSLKIDEVHGVTNLENPIEKSLNQLTCDKLYELAENEIDDLVNKGKLNYAKQLVEQLINADECVVYSEKFIESLYYKLGIISIKQGNEKYAEECLEKLQSLRVKSIVTYNLMSSIAYLKRDPQMLKEALAELAQLKEDEIEIEIKRLRYNLYEGEYHEIIKCLVENDELRGSFSKNRNANELLGIAYFNL